MSSFLKQRMISHIQLETWVAQDVESIINYGSSDNQIHEKVHLYVPRSNEDCVRPRSITRLETYA